MQAHELWPVRMLPLVLYAMSAGVVGQVVQVVPTGATEYLPAAHVVHTELVVVVQPAALLDVPAAQTVQAVQAPEPAAVE